MRRLKEHETELKQLGIEHLYLFGSTARSEARADSDVDLFFDHPKGSLGLYELIDVKETATRILAPSVLNERILAGRPPRRYRRRH